LGTSTTVWASSNATPKPSVTPGTWRAAGANIAGFKLVKESAHFAFYSDEVIADADLTLAALFQQDGQDQTRHSHPLQLRLVRRCLGRCPRPATPGHVDRAWRLA